MFDLNVPIAFSAGLISFFAPCVIPLLPAYIGYVAGVSFKNIKDNGYAAYRRRIITSSLFYILGFSIVFVLMGTVAAGFTSYFRRYDLLIQRIGGAVILFLGLDFAGILNSSFLSKKRGFKLPKKIEGFGMFRSFVVGVIFATAWTPCVGVVLGSILALAAVSGTAVEGASLLFIYSLGISIPFLITSIFLGSAPKYLKFINKRIGTITKIAGILLAILGLLLLTNTYKYLNSWLFEVAFSLGYEIR